MFDSYKDRKNNATTAPSKIKIIKQSKKCKTRHGVQQGMFIMKVNICQHCNYFHEANNLAKTSFAYMTMALEDVSIEVDAIKRHHFSTTQVETQKLDNGANAFVNTIEINLTQSFELTLPITPVALTNLLARIRLFFPDALIQYEYKPKGTK